MIIGPGNNAWYQTIYLVTTLFFYQGEILEFSGDFIHPLNKHQTANTEYFQRPAVRDRENILIMGDSLGDLCMADGAKNYRKNCLTIGFLNDKVKLQEKTASL